MANFYGELDQLKSIIVKTGIEGTWTEHENSHHRFTTKYGAVLAWWDNKKKTLIFQGPKAPAGALEAAFNVAVVDSEGASASAARMTASTSRETTSRVSEYFGDAGPFSYARVRSLTPVLLAGTMPYDVAVAGLEKIKFELARKCNLDVARLIASCDFFRDRTFYKLKKLVYSVDRDFALGMRPETVAVIDGIPHLIFLQARKNATPWAYSAPFMRRVLEEVYDDYFEVFRIWLIDTEALEGEDRDLKLVDLQTIAAMPEREFTRRIASLRKAWRLHLTEPRPRKERPDKSDHRQADFGFEDD